MNTETTQMFQAEITYINGMGNTHTTQAQFKSLVNMAEVLSIYGPERIVSIKFIN